MDCPRAAQRASILRISLVVIYSQNIEFIFFSYGENIFKEPPSPTWFYLFGRVWRGDLTVQILAVAAIVLLVGGLVAHFLSAAGGDAWIEGLAVAITCLVVTMVAVISPFIALYLFTHISLRMII